MTESTKEDRRSRGTAASVARRLLDGEAPERVAREVGCDPEALAAWRDRALDDLEGRLSATREMRSDERPGRTPGPEAALPPRRLHHVGIVARDEEQIERFASVLDLVETRREHLEKYRVTNVFFSTGSGAEIQFMLPDGGTLANYNGGRGGLHHVAFCTPRLEPLQRELESRGLRFIAGEKQDGIGRLEFNFVLPDIEGVNVELIEDPDVRWDRPGGRRQRTDTRWHRHE